jgi:hypothetical protein
MEHSRRWRNVTDVTICHPKEPDGKPWNKMESYGTMWNVSECPGTFSCKLVYIDLNHTSKEKEFTPPGQQFTYCSGRITNSSVSTQTETLFASFPHNFASTLYPLGLIGWVILSNHIPHSASSSVWRSTKSEVLIEPSTLVTSEFLVSVLLKSDTLGR